jgi:hypothetical protein
MHLSSRSLCIHLVPFSFKVIFATVIDHKFLIYLFVQYSILFVIVTVAKILYFTRIQIFRFLVKAIQVIQLHIVFVCNMFAKYASQKICTQKLSEIIPLNSAM